MADSTTGATGTTASPIGTTKALYESGASVHHRALPSVEEVVAREQQRLGRPLSLDEKLDVARTLDAMRLHEGHEAQHAQMALILIAAILISQITITIWKKFHPRSYHWATLVGLWIIPFLMALNAGNYRFAAVWILFSAANGIIIRKALESPMRSSTPRLVYKWYAWVYTVSYAFGGFGYAITMLAIFHVPEILRITNFEGDSELFGTGIIILFYGLYFGTLGRDFVDRLSDRMAVAIGYYSKTGFPRKHLRDHMCAICGDSTVKSSDPLHSLNCGHTYHEECIRGWTIIGKKDICPYCKEKVDLNAFKKNPWETTQQMYLGLLDMLRYILVWNPVVFIVVHVLFRILGLK